MHEANKPPADETGSSGEAATPSIFANVLIHAGYHKTGSTYLQEFVFRPEHGLSTETGESRTQIVRDIVVPDNFVFDAGAAREKYRPFVERAEKQGHRFVLSHERLSGYPPSGGYDRKLVADRLAQTFPGARILLVIREQNSLIRSVYSQYVTDGGDLPLRRFLETPEPALGRVPGFRLEVYEFDRLIEYYRGLFGEKRLLVLPFEMLLRERGAFVNRILAFMDRAPLDQSPGSTTNARRPVTMQFVQRWLNRLFSNNELSRGALLHIPRLPRRTGRLEPLFRMLTPRAVDEALHRRILVEIDRTVAGHYAASNDRTSELIGMDLAAYGYKRSQGTSR